MWCLIVILFMCPQQEEPKKRDTAEDKLNYLITRIDTINMKIDSTRIDTLNIKY